MERSRADKVIAFIHKYLIVPEGEHVGKPIVLAPFQIDFIRDVYDNPHISDTGILSIARKNAKTATIACLVLVHLVGSEARQNSRIVSGAQSRDQAAEVFNLASKMVMMSPQLSKIVKIIPSSKKLVGLPLNTEYMATSADAKTAHGKSPVVAIIDECGQVRGANSDFIDAIVTSQAAHKNPLLFYISTQAASDSDFFSLIIDDAIKNKPPKTVCHVYAADQDADVMDEQQWRKANPALGIFRSEDDMRKLAEMASRMPSFENAFRNLNLNQRVSAHSPFISRDAWAACGEKTVTLDDCSEIYGALDLSNKKDLTALVLVGLHDGKWHVFPRFWMPSAGLLDRVKQDKAPYDVWHSQGYLVTTHGATVDYDWVASELAALCAKYDVTAIAYDRWRIEFLQKELDRLDAKIPLVEWGQGFKDMSPALDALEGHILNKTIVHGGHPVLNMCAANATVVKNPAGDRKLEKIKNSGRIDGVVALAMACGIAQRNHEPKSKLDDFIFNPLVF